MRRVRLNRAGAALCALAGIALLVAGTDAPNAVHEAWFWWLKAAGLGLGALAAHMHLAAERPSDK